MGAADADARGKGGQRGCARERACVTWCCHGAQDTLTGHRPTLAPRSALSARCASPACLRRSSRRMAVRQA